MEENLIIKIAGDAKEFVASLAEVGSKTQDVGKTLAGVSAASLLTIGGMTAAVIGTVYAFREEEQAGVRLNNVITATGGIAGVTASAVEEMAEAQSKSTIFSKLQVEQGESVLLTFTRIGKEVFPQATQATLDLAAGMGTDASSAAQMLGRALQDPVQGTMMLHRAGIQLTEAQKQQIQTMVESGNVAGAQGIIIDAVKGKYGGMAQALAGGTGQFIKLKQIMEEVAASIGAQLAPALIWAATKIKDILKAVQDMKAIPAFFHDLVANISEQAKGLAKILSGAFHFDLNEIKEGIAQAAKATFDGSHQFVDAVHGVEEKKKEATVQGEREISATVMAENRARAQAQITEENRRVSLLGQARRAEQAAMILEYTHGSKDLIKLKQDEAKTLKLLADQKNKAIASALRAHLAEVQQIEDQAEKQEKKKKQTFEKEADKLQSSRYKLSSTEYKKFLAEHQQALMDSVATEESVREDAALKDMQDQIKLHNQELADEEQFGAAYAAINRAMHDTILQDSQKGFSELAQLTQSGNNTLKTIGKFAAAEQAAMKTAEGAISAYAALAGIPIVGPGLGAAAAAALIAYGVEQEQKIFAAAQGGLITGGIPGVDSVPVLAQHGELVVPTKNYDEVVNSVATQRAIRDQAKAGMDGAPVKPQNVNVTLTLNGSLSKIVTAQVNQDKALGRYRGSS